MITYTVKESKTPNGITKVEIFHGETRVKLIMNRVKEHAYQQRDYYLKMMRGVNGYTEWLNNK